MRQVLIILLYAAAAIFLSGCRNGHEMEMMFMESEGIGISVNGKVMLEYSPVTCQMGYSAAENAFWVCDDSMNNYFAIVCGNAPGDAGDYVTADVVWTTESDIKRKDGLDMKISRRDGDRLWLWNEKSRLGAVVQVLR